MARSQDKLPLALIQITDCHLFEDPASTLIGMNCNDSLDAVLALITEQEQHLDAFLCTGDLVQDGSVAGYKALSHKLEPFGKPYHWLCGNHDQRENMGEVIAERPDILSGICLYRNWQIIMLDSQVPGKIHGYLSQAELVRLEQLLEQGKTEGRFSLVCLHHNPVSVGAAWLQHHSLKNPEDLFAVLTRYTDVKGVLHGHIHQDKYSVKEGVKVWSTPSTCVQFHPDIDEFTVHELNPGYRRLSLFDDGRIETKVCRISQDLQIDLGSEGY